MDYQNLWFKLKEELIDFKNKEYVNVNDLIKIMNRLEIEEFNISKPSKTKLNKILRCNLCDEELRYIGNPTLTLPSKQEYRCEKFRITVFR